MASKADAGKKALAAHQYNDAIQLYGEALQSSPSPVWYINRSIAYARTGSYENALRDAEEAVLAAKDRQRRELIAQAQMRRAIALYNLKRYGDARLCFTWVRKLNEKEPGLGVWQAKIKLEYEKLPEDAPENIVTITETPNKPAPVKEEPTKSKPITTQVSEKAKEAPIAASTASQTPKEKIRHEFFQSSTKVTITIFAKGVPKEQTEIEFGSQSLTVRFPLVTGSTYDFTLLPLFAPIDVSQSTYSITPNKIELSLHKALSGQKWPTLEGTELAAEASQPAADKITTPAAIPQAHPVAEEPKAPTYPTSSKKGTKNWDAVAKDALKKEKKEDTEAGHENLVEDDDDIDEGDALQGFFRKLYKDANPDTRRAMMKSYIESNGTALSTNWDEVGKETVKTSPPDGMEAKKWGQ